MKLQDSLPEGVEVDGRFYPMDFDFRNVLRMIEVLDRDDMLPEAQAYKALKCVCKRPRNVFKVLNAVKVLLFRPGRKTGPKATDFVQDAELIRAAFRQVYHIDLYRDKVHYIEFVELLSAIPEGCRYADVVGIRVRPLPAPTKYNQKEREWLIRAKADVAIRQDEKEQADRYSQDVQNIANALMAWAGVNE